MANITTTYIPSEDRVRFIVSINIGDIMNWAVYVGAKHNHNQGVQGGDYPYFVERITGTNNLTFYKSRSSLYFADDYSAELVLKGTGVVADFDTFTIPTVGGGTSYDCINRNCLLRQDTQGFFSDYTTCNRVCEVKSVDFQVVGNGQMNVSVNGVSTVTVFPGETKPVTLRKGNQLGIVLIAYVGNHLVGLCDVPQTDCQTSLSYYLDILDANTLPQKMVATFAVDTVTPTKYNCVSGACQGPYTSGTYNSLAECQAACTVGATKYNCVSGTCQGPYTSGTYNSLSACQTACTITQKWKCTDPATNTCAQTSDGTFDTEALCKAATSCQPSGVQTWYCNTSTKVCSLQAGSGGYATKAQCDAVCGGGEICPADQIKDASGNCVCIDSSKMNIFGTCYKKNYVYIAAGAVVLMMMMKK